MIKTKLKNNLSKIILYFLISLIILFLDPFSRVVFKFKEFAIISLVFSYFLILLLIIFIHILNIVNLVIYYLSYDKKTINRLDNLQTKKFVAMKTLATILLLLTFSFLLLSNSSEIALIINSIFLTQFSIMNLIFMTYIGVITHFLAHIEFLAKIFNLLSKSVSRLMIVTTNFVIFLISIILNVRIKLRDLINYKVANYKHTVYIKITEYNNGDLRK
ncbi:hypothetical protein [Spiroplasma tabanidicola]|uniref:Uncharacterized protein n=1 Tax=Spiroplasma tabanidicola TaxID=324079 RepID=A0A6I6C8U7_9MOLU|nr:hypothetical protein [Spiroplasma tabanidicola]QGS52086.1 hypothetical protein STABA_v1c07300 [Spiroplasma tabanidicola]